VARVFIDGYITTAEDVKDLTVGCRIEVTGLSSYDNTWKDTGFFPRIRVRNRADIVCSANAAVILARSLSLKGKIGLNFYLELPETLLADAGAYITVNGEKIPVSEGVASTLSGKACRKFTVFMKISQLTEERLLRVFTGDGEPVLLLDKDGADFTETGYSYSAQKYIEAARGTSDEGLITLVNALSDFGSLAQKIFHVNEENREEVLADLSTVTADSVSQYAAKSDVKEGMGLSYYGTSLLLREDTIIRHYFKLTNAVSQYTFTVDGKTVTL